MTLVRPALIAWMALAATANAAEPDPQAEADARELTREARALAEEGDNSGALEKLRGAYRRYPSPKLLLNLGTVLRSLGRDAEAADSYEEYLRSPEADPARRGEVEVLLGQLRNRMARLHVTVSDPAATVMVDSRMVQTVAGAATVYVEPGAHTVVAQKTGAPAVFSMVAVSAGEERAVPIDLSAPPPPPKAAPTVIVMNTPQRAGLPRLAFGGALAGLGYLMAIAVGAYGLAVNPNSDAVTIVNGVTMNADVIGGKESGYSFIPLIGPLITAVLYTARKPAYTAGAYLSGSVDVAFQAVGLVLLISGGMAYGGSGKESRPGAKAPLARFIVVPGASGAPLGLSLFGAF